MTRKELVKARWTASGLLALLVVVLVVGSWWVNRDLPSDRFHVRVGFAGSAAKVEELTVVPVGLTRGAFGASLARDFWFVGAYTVALVALAFVRDGLRIARLRDTRAWALTTVGVSALADVAGNVVMLHTLHGRDGGGMGYSSDGAAIAVMALDLLKWVAVVGALTVAVVRWWSVMAPRARQSEPVAPTVIPKAPDGAHGICCSGGGIRAAAFALGALDGLDRHGGWVRSSHYVAAVSGGNYAASGWATTAMIAGTPQGAASTLIAHLQNPPADPAPDAEPMERRRSATQRHRFLKNGKGGLPLALGWAVGIVVFHALVLLAFAFVVSWPIGRVIGTETLDDWMFPDTHVLERRDWLPALLVAGFGVALGLLALVRGPQRPWLRRGSLVAFAAAAAGLVTFLVLPWALVTVRDVFSDKVASGSPENAAWSIAGVSVATLAGWVWAIAKGKVMRGLPYLGGVILALLLVLFGGKVANDVAVDAGWFATPAWAWAIVLGALAALYVGPGIQWASFRPIYGRGLKGSFVLDPAANVGWDSMPDGMPELIVCCAAQRVGLSPNGLPATSFTISPERVTHGDLALPRGQYLARVPTRLQETLSRPVGWMPVSGAAFASAMGRLSKGSTNAVFAGLGVNLGMWVPSPSRVRDGCGRFPRARLGYYVKEILGIYDPHDDMVFVSDGGHWDNLGLVELLRRECPTIVCLDASGDQPGSFNTLRQALALALTELDSVEKFDVSALAKVNDAEKGLLPPTSLLTIPITYRNRPEGVLLYANVRVAADQSLPVRRFARLDPKFPHYSTGDQFLDDQQFHFLVASGREAGAALARELPKLKASVAAGASAQDGT